MAGLTSTGFSPKLVDEVLDDIEGEQLASIDPALDLQPEEPLGQVNGIFAAALADVWASLQAVYRAAYAASASGEALDNVCALTGIVRLAAQPSTVTLYCVGTNGTVLPVGRIVTSPSTGQHFETTAEGTIATATARATTTAYVVGDVRSNAGNLYLCTKAGTTGGGGGPTTTSSAITDGTPPNHVVWRYLAAGSAFAAIASECDTTGSISANAGTLTQIDTPVSGWTTVTNGHDAELGRDVETDEDLRVRRAAALSTSGSATVDAIRAEVIAVADVITCSVYSNDTELTVDSIPPHAIEVIVEGGDDQAIADAILASKAAGITAYGGEGPFTCVDAQGFSHTDIAFTRPTPITITVVIHLTKNGDYPDDGDDQVKLAVKTFINALGGGEDVIRNKLFDIIFNISGVVDVTTLTINAGTSNIAIAVREVASCDIGDITVVAT